MHRLVWVTRSLAGWISRILPSEPAVVSKLGALDVRIRHRAKEIIVRQMSRDVAGAARRSSAASAASGVPVALRKMISPASIGFMLPLIPDWNGNIDPTTPLSVYIPLSFTWRRADQFVKATILAAPSEALPTYTRVQLNAPNATAAGYLDVQDMLIHVVQGSTAIQTDHPDRIVPLFETNGRNFRSDFAWAATEDQFFFHLYFSLPIQASRGQLHIPPFSLHSPTLVSRSGSFHPDPSKPDDFYTSIDLPTGSRITRVFFSAWKWLAGQYPWIVATGSTAPVAAGRGLQMIARIQNGVVIAAEGMSIIGDNSTGKVANQCAYSIGADLDRSPRGLYPNSASTTEYCDITEPNLIARGFTRGFRDTGGNAVFYRVDLKGAQPYTDVVARVYVQTDIPGVFPTPKIAVMSRVAVIQSGATIRQSTISSAAAVFSVRLAITVEGTPDFIYIGINANANNACWRLCGIQAGCGHGAAAIDPNDYPRIDSRLDSAAELAPYALQGVDLGSAAVADKLYFPAARKVTLHVPSLFRTRTEGAGAIASLAWRKNGVSYFAEGRERIDIDTATLGDKVTLTLRDPTSPDYRWRKEIRTAVAPSSATRTLRVLVIGDSLSYRYFCSEIESRLQCLGVTPIFIGTVHSSRISLSDFDGPICEARAGQTTAGYVGQARVVGLSNALQPVAIGDEAAYLQLPDVAKQAYCPFLRPATDADPIEHVFDDLIFDARAYLRRFALDTPDVVLWDLGTNDPVLDQGQHPRTEWRGWVQNGLRIAIPSLLSMSSSVRIGIGFHEQARGRSSDLLHDYRHDLALDMLAYTRKLASARVDWLDWRVLMSPENDWPMLPIGAPNPSTGLQRCVVNDPVHFGPINRGICVDGAVAWMIAT